jgi:hypothetical protein
METLNFKWGGDLLFFTNNAAFPECPEHHDNPYAFKVYAFKEAIRRGYETILWLDASVYCEKSPIPVFEHIEKHGYIMQEAGHLVGTWANDKALAYYGISRDEAMQMPMYGNAGFLGLSVHNAKAMKFLNMWDEAQLAGLFKGRWSNEAKTESEDERCKGHRHDMSCGSIIANILKMEYVSGNEWLQYKAPNEPAANETIIFGGQGI